MRYIFIVLLFIPSLFFGNSVSFGDSNENELSMKWDDEIFFAGNNFKNEITGEYFSFSEDGSFEGLINRQQIQNKEWVLDVVKGAWEGQYDERSEFGPGSTTLRIYSGNLFCEYYVYRKNPDYFWFKSAEKNFSNLCFDTLMKKY